MARILCFCHNSDRVQYCSSYQNNKSSNEIFTQGGVFSKASSCYNPLFFDSVATELEKYQPTLAVFSTENDIVTGTYFHSDFLPVQMKQYGYKLLTRDKYIADDQTNGIRLSIYIPNNENSISSVQLSKGLIFNDNKYQCDKIYLGVPRAMVIYVQTTFGLFAFINVLVSRGYPNNDRTICMSGMMKKFVEGKNIDQLFICGDMSNEFKISNAKLIDYDYIDSARQQDIPAGFEEDLPLVNNNNGGPPKEAFPLKNHQKFVVPTYSPSYTNRYVRALDAEQTYQELSKADPQGSTLIGYHDRIFHKTIRGYPIHCLLYTAILGDPMLSNPNPNVARQRNHLGILGVYDVEFDH